LEAEAVAAARLPGAARYCAACHVAHRGCPECGATILWSRIQHRWMECEGIETRAHCCPVAGVVLRTLPLPSTTAPDVAATHAEWAWGELPARDRARLVNGSSGAASTVRAAVAQGGGDGRGGMSQDGVPPTPRPQPAPDEQKAVVRGVQF
jgi:hypothetical protein